MHPNLLHLGHLTLPTFGVLAAAGLMLALVLSQRTAALSAINPDQLWDAGLCAILAAFLFSRLLLVIEHFPSFRAYPVLLLAVPSLTASGLLLTAVSTYLWLRWKRLPILPTLDAWSPCATLIWAFLALGHFAESSDPGLPLRSGTAPPLYPVALLGLCRCSHSDARRFSLAAPPPPSRPNRRPHRHRRRHRSIPAQLPTPARP